jgi:SNF2 family DNA or RNA helicase
MTQTRHESWYKLYPFQREGVAKLDGAESGLIADDMGLGKTFEGVARDLELRRDKYAYKRPTLIVAPSGTHWNAWVKTIREYEGHDRIPIWVIDRKKRHVLADALRDAINGTASFPCYVIIHYEALRLMPELKDVNWFHIIADECHRIKNRAAQQTRALKALKTKYKTGLSGTPADDKPQDLWSVLNWLWPKEFKSYWRFVNQCCVFEDPNLQKVKYGKSFKKIVGVNPDGARQMLTTIGPYYLRRKKDEVGIDMPKKYYTERYVTLPPGQRRAYDQMRKDMIAWVGERKDTPLVAAAVVSQLVRLQQFALGSVDFSPEGKVRIVDPSIKLDDLEEIIDGNPDEPLVVFSQSKSMVNLAVRRLQTRGIETRPYTGDVSQHDRDFHESQFQAGNIQVLCGTIAAGGEGITLHRSHTVIFFDRMWNPTRNRQAEDRAHRIGQVHPVQIIDIIARDTVDLGRKQRIANKWEALAMILGDKIPETTREAYLNASPDRDEIAMQDVINRTRRTLGA